LCGRDWRSGRNKGRGLKLCGVQLHVTADIRRHLGPFGDGDILPMHEEKDWAVITVPDAGLPFGMTTILLTLISSATSKSTLSPAWASAEDRLRPSRSVTAVPSSRTKPFDGPLAER
jgi:hypothetical protein